MCVRQKLFRALVFSILIGVTYQQIPTPGPVRAFLLDLVSGAGAPNVTAEFFKLTGDDTWELMATGATSPGGGLSTLIHPDDFTYTSYKMQLYTEEYYNSRGSETFYPYIEIIFEKKDEEPHMVVISMGPYGYSAYRGRSKPA